MSNTAPASPVVHAANDTREPTRQCRICGARTDRMRCDTPACNGTRTEAVGIRPGSRRPR